MIPEMISNFSFVKIFILVLLTSYLANCIDQ